MNSPEERYFAELSLRLRRLGFEPEPEEDGLLPVKWEGERLCRFEPNGTMRYHSPVPPEKEPTLGLALREARVTSEYMRLLEQSPPLVAQGLSDGYRLMSYFNGTVLAGKQSEFGAKFVTWDWTFDRAGVCQGHYYENYTAAKNDFAVRSGLVDGHRLFSDKHLAEIYRCVKEVMDSGYPITDERKKLLEGVSNNIEYAVNDLDRLVEISNQKELEAGMEQTM